MDLSYDVGDLVVEFKVPALASLNVMVDPTKNVRRHAATKEVVKTCIVSPSFDDLERQYPTCFAELGSALLIDLGFEANFEVMDEDQVSDTKDENFINAFVDQKKWSAKSFPEGDHRGKLFPVLYHIGPDREERKAILRFPLGKEVDRVMASYTLPAFQALLKSTCVHGDMAELESISPGTYYMLGMFLLSQASAGKVSRRGK